MDITALFREVHADTLSRKGGNVEPLRTSFLLSRQRRLSLHPQENPFSDALSAITRSAERVVAEAHQRILLALAIVDDAASTDVQRSMAAENLALSEVGLCGSNSAVGQLVAKIEKLAPTLLKSKRGPESTHLLDHTMLALRSLGDMIKCKRIAAALAAEELEAHKRFGLLCASGGVVDNPYQNEVIEPLKEAKSQIWANIMLRRGQAGQTDARPDNEPRTPEVPSGLLNDMVLLDRRKVTHASDALQVEASIRELGLLTTIMQEQVALQAEQVSFIERNVKESKANVEKGTEELRKPLQSRWNMKRLLLVFLWINIVVLWLMDKVVR